MLGPLLNTAALMPKLKLPTGMLGVEDMPAGGMGVTSELSLPSERRRPGGGRWTPSIGEKVSVLAFTLSLPRPPAAAAPMSPGGRAKPGGSCMAAGSVRSRTVSTVRSGMVAAGRDGCMLWYEFSTMRGSARGGLFDLPDGSGGGCSPPEDRPTEG